MLGASSLFRPPFPSSLLPPVTLPSHLLNVCLRRTSASSFVIYPNRPSLAELLTLFPNNTAPHSLFPPTIGLCPQVLTSQFTATHRRTNTHSFTTYRLLHPTLHRAVSTILRRCASKPIVIGLTDTTYSSKLKSRCSARSFAYRNCLSNYDGACQSIDQAS